MKTVTVEIKYCDQCPHCYMHGGYIKDIFYEVIVDCSKDKNIIQKGGSLKPYNVEIPDWCPLEDI